MDVIVIGAGPAGLYAAERLMRAGRRVLVLEATDRVGGRAHNQTIDGAEVETGAGVGRWPHDKRLAEWLEAHGQKVKPTHCALQYWSEKEHEFVPASMNIPDEARALPRPSLVERRTLPFGAWLKSVAGSAYTRLFVHTSSYDDYLKADIVDTLDHYRFQDVAPICQIFPVHWDNLFSKVVKDLTTQGVRLHLSEPVLSVVREEGGYVVATEKGTYKAPRIVLAIPSKPAQRLLARSGYPSHAALLKQVRGQPFVRAYVRFIGPPNFIEKHARDEIVCSGPFRKIIPMDRKKRVYMIAYCDNVHTRFWKRLMRLPKRSAIAEVRASLHTLFGETFSIDDIHIYYHKYGTHYYTPLPEPFTTREEFLHAVVHIDRGFTMVGEAVAIDQGWTNSALATVARYLS